jgi:saccharopine dehydrogenase-like NADP-dependent oxidoreductase
MHCPNSINRDRQLTKYRGVLLALQNAGSYYQGGKVVNVAGPELMAEAKPYPIYPGFAFVAYPNRDSTVYKERYVFHNLLVEILGL